MADESDPSLLERFTNRIHGFQGVEESAPAQPAQFRPAGHAAWLRKQYNADPQMWRDYLQAAVRHPHLFQGDTASIAIHVEPVVQHFASDGLTRQDYFKAVAADPLLLRQKPAAVIGNLETVMSRYAADQLMRADYLQAAVDQPMLFRTPPETVFATVETAVNRLEAEGITRSDFLRQAVHQPRLFTQESQAIRAQSSPENCPSVQGLSTSDQLAASSPLPCTAVLNPVLDVSYVAPTQGLAR